MFFRLASTKIGGSGNVASHTFHPRGEVATLLCSRSCLMSTLTACGMVTEGLLGGQTGADGFTSAPVQGERKTVTVSKGGPSLGLHITNDSSGWALIEGVDPGSIAHEAPGICVGDRILAINGTTVFGTGHRDVAAMIRRVPVGGIVVFGLIEPEREQLSSAQTLTGSD